jgi:hypothetical protein
MDVHCAMSSIKRHPFRLFLLSLLTLAILIIALFNPASFLPWQAASASPGSVNALTPAQQSAIQGAEQILLLPGEFHWSYLPLLQR